MRLAVASFFCIFILIAAGGLFFRATVALAPSPDQARPKKVESRSPAQSSAPSLEPFRWSSVESPSYLEYIANLRKVGCPEETIRDIVITDVCKLYAQRRAEASAQIPFWMTDSSPEILQAKSRLTQLDQEEAAVIQKLLGLPWNGIEDYLGRNSPGYLSLQKSARLDRLKTDLQAQIKAIETAAQNRELTIHALEKQFERDLGQLLTPAELEEYKLRNSFDSTVLRRNLLGLSVSEEEFRQMFRARQQLNDLIAAESERYASDDFARQRVATGIRNFEGQLEKLLGPERYADYQRAEDNAYQRLRQFAASAGVPETEANQLYEFKRQLERVARDRELSRDHRSQLRHQLQAEARAFSEKFLGEKWHSAYLERGGSWMKPE